MFHSELVLAHESIQYWLVKLLRSVKYFDIARSIICTRKRTNSWTGYTRNSRGTFGHMHVNPELKFHSGNLREYRIFTRYNPLLIRAGRTKRVCFSLRCPFRHVTIYVLSMINNWKNRLFITEGNFNSTLTICTIIHENPIIRFTLKNLRWYSCLFIN